MHREPVLSSVSSYERGEESVSMSTSSDPNEYLKSPVSFRGQQSPAMIGGRKAKKQAHTRERTRADQEVVGEGFDLQDSRQARRPRGSHSPRGSGVSGGAVGVGPGMGATYTVSPVASPIGRGHDFKHDDESDTQSLTEFLFGSGTTRLNYFTPTHVSTVHPMEASSASHAVGDSIIFPSRNAVPSPRPTPVAVAKSSTSSSSSVTSSASSSVSEEESSAASVTSESSETSTSSSSSEEPDVDIPPMYLHAAERLNIAEPKKQLGSFFKDYEEGKPGGLAIEKLLTAFKYRTNVFESIPCSLKVSRTSPVLIVVTPQSGTYRYLMPDPKISPSVDRDAQDVFRGYEYEGSGTAAEVLRSLQGRPGVCCRFKNTRAPVWFELLSAEDEEALVNCLRVLTQVWKDWTDSYHFSAADYKRPATVPMPSLLNGKKKMRLLKHLPADHSSREEHFGSVLNTKSTELISSRAVALYWKTERLTWVYFRSLKDGVYKGKHLRLFIHPYGPHLMISDRRGGILKGILDIYNYSVLNGGEGRPPIASENKTVPFVSQMGLLNDPNPIYFAFESKEDLLDFQQTVATMAYMLSEGGSIVPN